MPRQTLANRIAIIVDFGPKVVTAWEEFRSASLMWNLLASAVAASRNTMAKACKLAGQSLLPDSQASTALFSKKRNAFSWEMCQLEYQCS